MLEIVEEMALELVLNYADKGIDPMEWDWKGLDDTVFRQFNMRLGLSEEQQEELTTEALQDLVRDRALQHYEEREQDFTPPVMRYLEKVIMLQTMDSLWKDHLFAMDHLKEGIGLRGYGQKNPLQEYKKEAFSLFDDLSRRMQEDVVEKLYSVQVARQEDVQRLEEGQAAQRPHADVARRTGRAPPAITTSTAGHATRTRETEWTTARGKTRPSHTGYAQSWSE